MRSLETGTMKISALLFFDFWWNFIWALELCLDVNSWFLKISHTFYEKRWFLVFFWFPFTNIHNSQDNREKGNAFLTSLYHFHSLHRQLDISLAITAAYSPLHIASCRIRTGNIWFPRASRWTLSYTLSWCNFSFIHHLL